MPPKLGSVPEDVTEIFKALSDPMRWTIVVEMSRVDELGGAALEDMVPVSKPTISYHIKVLYHAGLIEVRKDGRYIFYKLRRDVLRQVIDEMTADLAIPRAKAKRRAISA